MSLKTWQRLLALLGALWCSTPHVLDAHQQKEAITEILFNTRSGNLEVMHRYLLHDAEHAVRVLLDAEADIVASETSREQFAHYAIERFALLDDDGDTLKLHYVGQEVDGVFLWVYQEMPLPAALSQLGVVDNVLRELWPEQHNLVNIERQGKIQSLSFSGDTEWLTVRFEE